MRTLVATDLSEASDEALRQAFASARSAGGPVAICHVMPEFAQVQGLFPLDAPSDLAADFEPRAQTINAMREQLRRVFPTAAEDVEMRLDEGAPYAGILNQAERWRADRVVVGSGTKTGIERVLLGSVAARVVRYAHCPVLVARPVAAGAVLVATDLSDPSMPALRAGAEEARLRQVPRLVVLHVEEVAEVAVAPAFFGAAPIALPENLLQERREAARRLIEGALERFEMTAEIEVVYGDAAHEILQRSESLPAEVLVVGTRGRTGFSRLLLGSVAERLVRDASCSVLAVRLMAE